MGMLRSYWLRALIAYDLIFRGEEMAIAAFQFNDYKDKLPAYDPNSEESKNMAAAGIYTDYVCQNGDAYSQDLTKSSGNLT